MTILFTIHFIVVFLFILFVFLQKSSRGIVGSNNMGDIKSILAKETQRGLLTSITTFLAILFFVTSIILAVVSVNEQKSILGNLSNSSKSNISTIND